MNRSRALSMLSALSLAIAMFAVVPGPASAAVSIDFDGPVLIVTGDGTDNDIYVECNGGKVKVTDVTSTTDCTAVEGLIMKGMGGADTLSVSPLNIGTYPNLTEVELYGGPGYDELFGWPGDETLSGGKSNDYIHASGGDDLLIGGGGQGDSLAVQADVNVNLGASTVSGLGSDDHQGFEVASLEGGPGGNILQATQFPGFVLMNGRAGGDQLLAGDGGSHLTGGPGPDHLAGGNGNDFLRGDDGSSTGDDLIEGGGGDDDVQASITGDSVVTDVSMTGSGGDTLDSVERANIDARVNSVMVNASDFDGQVTFDDSDGHDIFIGGPENDFVNGIHGTDILAGGGGKDSFLAYSGPGDATLTETTFTSGLGTGVISEFEVARIWGTDDTQTLDGSDWPGELELTPRDGDDQVAGNGADTLLISFIEGSATLTDSKLTCSSGTTHLEGIGEALVLGSAGNDRLRAESFHRPVEFLAGAGNDRFLGGPRSDYALGGYGNDTFLGGPAADSLIGQDGGDDLNGGLGTDRCNGGSGVDHLTSCERFIKEPKDDF